MRPASAVQADHCFLSYSRADADFALRLADDLTALGVAMWVDRLNIRPSENWDRAIEHAIRGCRSFIVILSPRAVASENVADEISLAIDSAKPMIPIMIEPCQLPLRLTRKHLIDASSGYEAALNQCFAEIESGQTGSGTAIAKAERGVKDPKTIATAARELATFVGPIAEILTERAALRAASVDGLYRLLALHIPKESDRLSFLPTNFGHPALTADAGAAAALRTDGKARSIPPRDLQRIAQALTRYLGPIALVVAKKESRASGSIKELLGRLAGTLRSEDERTDFLRRVESQ
jgi:hypothetical protein